MSKFEVSPIFFLSVILCCLVLDQSTMSSSLLFFQDGLQWTNPLFFWLNPCQVLLLFRAVQVKQLAFLASFLSDLFRRLATLSCKVLMQRFQGRSMGRGNSQWLHSGQTNVGSTILTFLHLRIFLAQESSMTSEIFQFQNVFPLPCLMLGGYFHLDFSATILCSALLRMASTSRSTIFAATGLGDGSGSNFYHSQH